MMTPFLVTNAVAVALFAIALKWPNVARRIVGTGFMIAGIVNCYIVLRDPQAYVRGFGPHAISVYRAFINSAFATNPAALVLPIAAGLLLMGALVLTHDPWVKLALVGMIEFLVAISPLGLGSAFPATLILSATMVVLFRQKWQPRKTSISEPTARIEACGR
jgi:hypothetical protein